MRAKRFVIIIEQGTTGYGAYSPDVPGCAVVGDSEQEVRQLLSEAIAFHLGGLRERGELLPEPHSAADYIEVAAKP